MPQVVLKKTEEAIADSDIVLFMVDARQGVTEADRHYARYRHYTGTDCKRSTNGMVQAEAETSSDMRGWGVVKRAVLSELVHWLSPDNAPTLHWTHHISPCFTL